MASEASVTMAISLPLHNQVELRDLLSRLYDPSDPMYGNYLTPQQFTDEFCPTQADYEAVTGYARSLGLKVVATHPNRTLLDVSGPAQAVESAFNLRLHRYQASDGREFFAPDNDPEVPDFIASLIEGVIGLNNAAVWHAHNHFARAQERALTPLQIGTGPGGALAPRDITTAYNLSGVSANGSGQSLGLFELDGYTASDIAYYENYYGLAAVPLQNVLVDGFSGRAGSGATEVTLDIELMVATAQGASKIYVYEGPNSDTGVVDTYNRIATDNLAKQISTSWGLSETQTSSFILSSENNAFKQMMAQGQSIYAAAGDSGAFDNGRTLSVDDPASQPFMVGVGGTQLFVNSGEAYNHETTWNNGSVSGGAGGGGISVVWGIPSYQQGLILPASLGSTSARNVPDVSINADQYTGYSVFYRGNWYIFGGTSCGAPLWAAFTARVNQQRAANGVAPLGFANPALYQIGTGASYGFDFNDIADGSTNLHYPAVTGYDLATGWGSFNGANLLADLSGTPPTTKPSPPQNLVATAGNAQVTLTWTASTGAASYNVYRSTTSGQEIALVTPTITAPSYTNTGLTNGTTYYYTVTATNSKGTSNPSIEVSATPVAPALTITSGPTASASRGNATVQWTTNLASNSLVYFGTTPSLGRSSGTNALVTSHSVLLSVLSRHTTYYYQVSSTGGGATVVSAVLTFTTQ